LNTITFDAAVTQNMGNVRKNNEDNLYISGTYLTAENRDISATFKAGFITDVPVFGVFDGMGGEAMGEEASLIAASTVHECTLTNGWNDNPDHFIRASIELANERICRLMGDTGEQRIGTTFSAVTIKDDSIRAYNVGDSRIYIFRDGVLTQLSVDDTNGQRLLNMGVITKEELATHKDRHKLTQHLGIRKEEMTIEPHVTTDIRLKKGDKLLLCSDGLTDMVDDSGIATLLSNDAEAAELSRALVVEALNNGGRDNVTAMVIIANTNPTSAASEKTVKSDKRKIIAIAGIAAAVILIAAIVTVIVIAASKAGGKKSDGDDNDDKDKDGGKNKASVTESVDSAETTDAKIDEIIK